jgi:hypothetical protein
MCLYNIAALPARTDRPQAETFFADVGSRARLDCAITPSMSLLPLYYVTWRNASNHRTVFYRIPPTLTTGQQPTSFLDGRYTLDSQNFSLFISDVEPADAASDYQCVLGVVEPVNRQFVFTSTANSNLSLSLFCE